MTQAPVSPGSTGVVHLRAAGVSVVVDASGAGVPAVLHWGRDLGERVPAPWAWVPARPHSAVDVPVPLTLLAGGVGATQHRAALRGAPHWAPRWRLDDVARGTRDVTFTCTAGTAGLTLVTELALDDEGVLRIAHELHNVGPTPYGLDRLGVVLPVPAGGDRAARPDRALVPRTAPAAARLDRAGHLGARLPARAHRARRDAAARRRDAGLRQPARRGARAAPGLERRPDLVGGAATGRPRRARRRRAARAGRGGPRAGGELPHARCRSRSGPARGSTA